MAFKQDRDSGSKLDSYSSMQDKGLIGKIKDKVTAKRRDNLNKRESVKEYIDKSTHMMDAKEKSAWEKQNKKAVKQIINKYGDVETAKEKRAETWNKDRTNIRFEERAITVASKDDVKATGVNPRKAKPIKEKMWVKKEILPRGGGERDLSYMPHDHPKQKVKLKDRVQETQDTLTQYQKMRDEIRDYSYSDRRNIQWKSKKGKLGKKDWIKNKYGFGGTYEGTSSTSGGSRGAGEGGGVYSGPSDMSKPSKKSRALAVAGAGVVVGSWLASQGKSLLSGKPARNVKTTYSMTNPTQETLRSGKGKIGK